MVGKTVVFHPEAAAEYEAAFDWYFERSELAASKFAMELNTAVEAHTTVDQLVTIP